MYEKNIPHYWHKMYLRKICRCLPVGIGFFITIVVTYFISVTIFQFKLSTTKSLREDLVAKFENGENPLKFVPKDVEPPVFDKLNPGKEFDTGNIHRIVHFDLKGAPPNLEYMKQIFPLLRKMGATGLLMEYEDMFPYWHNLSTLSRPDAYNVSTITEIIKVAHENKLIVIPLIQTYGHFEFVLKHDKFKHLREVPSKIQNLNPALPESVNMVTQMLDQVLTLHPMAEYIHVGCDEVRSIGLSPESVKMMKEKEMEREDLFLYHVTNVLKHVRGKYKKVTPLMWDDMLRKIPNFKLKIHNMGSLVEPMVWLYVPDVAKRFRPPFWADYRKVFKSLWTASAFKGATGQDQYVINIGYHVANNAAWRSVMKETHSTHFPNIIFKGIVLTGWQRYDHVLPLCELLPVAIPSLAVNLQVLLTGRQDSKSYSIPRDLLKCRGNIPLDLPVTESNLVKCSFPGSDIYDAVMDLRLTRVSIEAFVKRGTRDDAKRDVIKQRISHHIDQLPPVLLTLFGQDTIREFMDINVIRPLSKIPNARHEALEAMGNRFPWLRPTRQI